MREPFMLSFPLDEYRARLDKLIAIMQRDGIDAAIFTSDNNTFYFTGFQSIVWGSKVSTPGVVVVTADGGLALCTTRGGVETAKVTSLVEDIRYTGAGGYPTLAECIASVLAGRKLLSGRIGLELGYGHKLHFNYANQQAMFHELRDAQIVDLSEQLWQLRGVKSPREIERMREASRINSRAIEKCFREIRPGMTERELAQRISATYFLMGADETIPLGLRAGVERYSQGNCPPSDRKIGAHEMILVDGGPGYRGYYSDIIRQAMVGRPTDRQLDLFNVAREATYVGIRAAQPGATMGEVCEAIFRFISSSPYAHLHPRTSGYGHSIGLNVHEAPMVVYSDVVLQPGMTIAIEPEIFEAGMGSMGVEENILITETGNEIMSDTDSHLMILDL